LDWPGETDQVMLLVYFPALQKASYVLSGANRTACPEVLNLQPDLLNQYMEVYISL